MKTFKFFSGINRHPIFVPIRTWDTDTTYHIPIDLYGNILEIGLSIHHGHTLAPTIIGSHLNINEVGQAVYYQYRITDVLEIAWFENSRTATRVRIFYQIRFPDQEYFCKFKTVERIR